MSISLNALCIQCKQTFSDKLFKTQDVFYLCQMCLSDFIWHTIKSLMKNQVWTDSAKFRSHFRWRQIEMSLLNSFSQLLVRAVIGSRCKEKWVTTSYMCKTLYIPICSGTHSYTSEHKYICQVRPFSFPPTKIVQTRLILIVSLPPAQTFTPMCLVLIHWASQFYRTFKVCILKFLSFSKLISSCFLYDPHSRQCLKPNILSNWASAKANNGHQTRSEVRQFGS